MAKEIGMSWQGLQKALQPKVTLASTASMPSCEQWAIN
jgi:hypothetical protein